MNKQKTAEKTAKNKPEDNQSNNNGAIAAELSTIRKILFEQALFQIGIEADTLKTLMNSREVKNAKKK